MKHIASKLFRALCGMAVMLVLAASITSIPVLAVSNGIYIATATPHYKHPVTGKIEDSGGEGSAVLGQSMTESATYKKALVEVDANGSTYVTVRLKLMDNIQNPKFRVDGSSVSATLMQEDFVNNTTDYRMKVKNENSVIRCSMYVVPMGREVIFYITVSDLQSGSDDFITSVKVENTKPAESQKPAATQQQTDADTQTQTEPASQPRTSESTAESTEAETDSSVTEPSETIGAESAVKADAPAGLQEFDASGNKVETGNADKSDKDNGWSYAVWWVLGGVVIVLIAGFSAWYFALFRKKR